MSFREPAHVSFDLVQHLPAFPKRFIGIPLDIIIAVVVTAVLPVEFWHLQVKFSSTTVISTWTFL